MASPARERLSPEEAPGPSTLVLYPPRTQRGTSLGRALPLGLSVLLHLAVLGLAALATLHSRRPPLRIPVQLVEVTFVDGTGGREGGGGGGAPVRPQPRLAAPAPSPAARPVSWPRPAPHVTTVPPPAPSPKPALPAAPPPPPAATELVARPAPEPTPEPAPAASPPSSAGAPAPAAAEGAGGSGGGVGTGIGTGVGSGSGSGIGNGIGSGVGDGAGDGTEGDGTGAGGSFAKVLEGPRPPYPRDALRAQWEGAVRVRVIVAPDGSAASVVVRATSGHEVLDRAAVAAVRKWRFAPARRAGQPILSRADLTVRFRLDDDE
jgi:protein TonB